MRDQAVPTVAASTYRHQTQDEANAYWAQHEHKKWVVTFTKGPQRNRTIRSLYVGSKTAEGAKRGGLAAARLLGLTWAGQANCRVRLATANDLGCVYTGGAHA